MILADTNFWLALILDRHVFHVAVRRWLARQLAAGSVLFCRATQQSLLRLLTTEAVTRPYGIPPMTNAEAWSLYDGILADRRIAFAPETLPDQLQPIWKTLASRGTASPKLWMDAYLAAFALAGGHELVTTDQAFTQFPNLRVNLLTPQKP